MNYSVNSIGQRTNRTTTDAANATSTAQWGCNATGEKPRRLVGVLDRSEAPCLEEVSSREAAANQLTKANHSDTAQNRSYNYDGIGNRLTSSDGVSPASSTTYTPNALNQYTAISGGAFQAPSPDYDDDGNAIAYPLPINSASNATLVWDGENRLIKVTSTTATVDYFYDSSSRRIALITSDQSTSDKITLYIYDDWNSIAEYRLHNSSFNLHTSLLWGLDLSSGEQGAGGVGGLLQTSDHSSLITSYFPCYDGNGNITEYIDASATVVAHYEYDAFGNTVVSTGAKASDFAHRFSTKPLDAESGLYYYGYRFYDPSNGRWINRDPIEEGGGLNLYGFVANDGVKRIDLFGLEAGQDYNTFDEAVKALGTDIYTATKASVESGKKEKSEIADLQNRLMAVSITTSADEIIFDKVRVYSGENFSHGEVTEIPSLKDLLEKYGYHQESLDAKYLDEIIKNLSKVKSTTNYGVEYAAYIYCWDNENGKNYSYGDLTIGSVLKGINILYGGAVHYGTVPDDSYEHKNHKNKKTSFISHGHSHNVETHINGKLIPSEGPSPSDARNLLRLQEVYKNFSSFIVRELKKDAPVIEWIK